MSSRLLPLAALLLTGCSVKPSDRGETVTSEIVNLVAPETLGAADVGAVRVDDDLLHEGRSLTDWPALAFNYAQQRFSPLAALTPDTARGLAIAWTASLDGSADAVLAGPMATPIVAGDILYATGGGGWVRAFDTRTGEAIWSGDPDAPPQGAATPPPGAALWKGRLFVAETGGALASYDAKTGRRLWRHQVGEPGDTITSTPLVADNLLFVGAQRGGRGSVVAIDYNEGAERWRFWTAPTGDGAPDGAVSDAALAQVSATWGDARPATLPGTDPAATPMSPSAHGGATVGSLAYDPVGDRLILGTGAARVPVPIGAAVIAPARLFSRSLIAIDARRGTFTWSRQLPGSGDASGAILLARMAFGGGPAPVAVTVTAAGELALVALADGALVGWRPDAGGGGGAIGATPAATPRALAGPGSYSPDAGLLFLPLGAISAVQAPGQAPAGTPPLHASAALTAIDPLTGVARWQVTQTGARSGLLTTAGGLLLQGSAAGRLTAFEVATGRAVWSAAVGGPVAAAPSSFVSAGRQTVAFVVAGAVQGAPARLVLLRGPAVAPPRNP